MAGRYERVKPLAAGGMGEVFVAHDTALDRDVALKTVELATPEQNSVFLHEARVLGALEHPHIVPVHDVGEDAEGRPFLAMQYVRGETLAEVIARLAEGDPETHRQFSFTRRLRIIQQICEALDYAHSRGVLHRDIKPANVMLGPFGEVVVVDWGLSARGGQALENALTPAYSAPERIQHDTHDERGEVFSIAALMYELFALRPAFSGELKTVLMAIIHGTPKPPEEFLVAAQGRVPLEVSYIVMRGLQKKPEDRFQSPRELGAEIQKFLDGAAPVVCVHTGFKRMVLSFARFVDNHGRLAIISTVVAVSFFLISYAVLLVQAL